MGRVIPHLERSLKEWSEYQWPKTLTEWAVALRDAGFMSSDSIPEVEAVLSAAVHRGEWDLDDPLSAAQEFLTAAQVALVVDGRDRTLHEAVAKALFDELFLLIGLRTIP